MCACLAVAPGDLADWYRVDWRDVWTERKIAPQDFGARLLPRGQSKVAPWPYYVHRSLLPVLGAPSPTEHPIEIQTPMGVTLRRHQKRAVEFIRNRRGSLITDEPRCGKSASILFAHDAEAPLLVVGPVAARMIWHEWAARRFGACATIAADNDCRICARVGVYPERGERSSFLSLEGRAFRPELIAEYKPHVLFCTFAVVSTWRRLFATLPNGLGMLVVDEAHLSGVQNRKSQTVESLRWLNTIAERTVMATGSPLYNRVAGLWPLLDLACPAGFGDFWTYARRYCSIGETLILCGDYRQRPIREIKVGDEIIGWRRRSDPARGNADEGLRDTLCKANVVAVHSRFTEVVRITFASGDTVVCTPDHLWLNARGHNEDYPFTTALPLASGRGRPAKEGAKELVRVLPPIPANTVFNDDYARGYVQGALDGDGALHLQRYATDGIRSAGCVLRVISRLFAERFRTHAEQIGFPTTWRERAWYTCADGRRRSQYVVYLRGGHATYTKIKTWEGPSNFDAWCGWLAGIYDAEGNGEKIAQYERVNPETYARICTGLAFFNFRFSRHPEHISILGDDATHDSRRSALLRFWTLTRPALAYKLDHIVLQGRFKHPDRVVAIERLNTQMEVFSLTTTTGNYIAQGHASKNCAAVPTAHGWKAQGESNMPELRARLAEVMLRRTWAELQSSLPPITRTLESVKLPEEVKVEIENVAAQIRYEQGGTKTIIGELARLRKLYARAKLEHAIGLIQETLANGHPCVAWVWHQEVAAELTERLRSHCQVIGPITGATSDKARERMLEEAQTLEGPRVIIANILALGTAVSLAWASHEIFVELDWVPVNIAQAEMRPFDGKHPVSSVYLVADVDCDEQLAQAVISKLETTRELGLQAGVGDVGDVLRASLGIERASTLYDLAERLIECGEDYV